MIRPCSHHPRWFNVRAGAVNQHAPPCTIWQLWASSVRAADVDEEDFCVQTKREPWHHTPCCQTFQMLFSVNWCGESLDTGDPGEAHETTRALSHFQ